MLTLHDAYLQSLPPVSYDPRAAGQIAEASAVAAVLDAVLQAASQLIAEHDPSATELAITDWERNYGLPDPCAGTSSSLDRRRADLVAKLLARQSLSASQMVAIAERLGYVGAQVVEFEPMTCTDPCDQALFDPEGWRFVWALRLAQPLRIEQMQCTAPCNTALRSWGNEPIYCALARHKPAHTLALAFFNNEV